MIVRVIFISSFFFYCLLSNRSFPTNPNRITNCFQTYSLLFYNFYKLHLLKCVFVYFDFLKKFCTEAGMRMCTLFEVQNGKHISHSDECGLSSEYVWTNSKCMGSDNAECNSGGEAYYVSTINRPNSPLGQGKSFKRMERVYGKHCSYRHRDILVIFYDLISL